MYINGLALFGDLAPALHCLGATQIYHHSNKSSPLLQVLQLLGAIASYSSFLFPERYFEDAEERIEAV